MNIAPSLSSARMPWTGAALGGFDPCALTSKGKERRRYGAASMRLGTEGFLELCLGTLGIFGPGAGYGTSVLGVTVWVPEDLQERAKELIVAYLDGV